MVMDKKKIVVAFGGNALGTTLPEQAKGVKHIAKAVADLIVDGHDVIITHGNGPQVGLINSAVNALLHEDVTLGEIPLQVCDAMSQAYIGYDIQNALREELLDRGIDKGVATMVTQVRVDKEDEAFSNPTKPIGRYMSKEKAEHLAEKYGYIMKEYGDLGYRRVVPSPKPQEIVELDAINAMINQGCVVVCCGGGGIPVIRKGNHLKGASAVIDKDYASELLAEKLDADFFLILTAVEKVAVNFNTPDEKWLDEMSVDEAKEYIKQGQFARGSMFEKVDAAVKFVESKEGRLSLITLIEKACDGINFKTGTVIHK
ncbi:MAG: carbamate kinase [Oscillospiraceae bacterium]|nr:carbamate kinase [Candidatus Ruminococcus equi]